MFVKLVSLMLICFAITSEVYAVKAVEVYAKDEASTEAIMIKPRIYLKNTGDEVLSNFVCKYTFTLLDSKVPVVDDFYTPYSAVSLESNGGNSYTLVYNYNGLTLQPQTIAPEVSGSVVGIRYPDWSNITLANPLSGTFTKNVDIKVYDENGILIGEQSDGLPVAIINGGTAGMTVVTEDGSGRATVALDASGSFDNNGSIVKYEWLLYGIVFSQNVVFNASVSVDTDDVTLRVTDNDGNVTTVSIAINVVQKDYVSSLYDLAVYTRSFDLEEDNVSKIRMYVMNNGTNDLNGFKVRYYFNLNYSSSVPVGEFWYLPKADGGSVGKIGDKEYYLEIDYSNSVLKPGYKTPNAAGNVFAYHKDNWGPIDYSDDYSFLETDGFELNYNVAVFDLNGTLIYGSSPEEESNSRTYANVYNFAVTNPVVSDFHYTYDVANVADGVPVYVWIYNPDGSLWAIHEATPYLHQPLISFQAGKTYRMEVLVNGYIDYKTTFYIPLR